MVPQNDARGHRGGRQTCLTIALTPEARHTLLTWQRTTTLPAGQVRRGRIVLLLADGLSITRVADAVGISRRHVYKWVARFQAQGVAGLVDRPRPARRRRAAAREEDTRCPGTAP